MFENLPDEVLLKIFSFLPMKSLFQLMAVNKRIRAVVNDDSLWEKVHLIGHANDDKFPPEFLKKIIAKGCKYLALDCCGVERREREVKFEKNFTLKYLCFDRCGEVPNQEFDILPDFAASCHGLEKFYVKRSDSDKNHDYQSSILNFSNASFKAVIHCEF